MSVYVVTVATGHYEDTTYRVVGVCSTVDAARALATVDAGQRLRWRRSHPDAFLEDGDVCEAYVTKTETLYTVVERPMIYSVVHDHDSRTATIQLGRGCTA